MLLGHVDTVWPRGTLARMPWRLEDGRAYGPGVFDMKGGLVVMVEAIRLARHCACPAESSSPPTRRSAARQRATRSRVRRRARRRRSSASRRRRRATSRRRARVSAASSRRSRDNRRTRAIRRTARAPIQELARLTLRLHALTDKRSGVSANVGVVAGGTRENVVAAEATAWIDVRVPTLAERDRLDELLRRLEPETPGTSIAVEGGWTRPPLEPSEGSTILFEQAREHGREARPRASRDRSPGRLRRESIGALGVPVLDGLGALGAGSHADDEHVLVASLPIRAQLLAAILRSPGL